MTQTPRESERGDEEQWSALSWSSFFSWNGVGWNVALLIGVWGVLMGMSHYILADAFFILPALLFCIKWGHFTNIHKPFRQTGLFSIGVFLALSLTIATVLWTSAQARAAEQDKTKLLQLDLIPGLQQQIQALKAQNLSATGAISKKQETIEGLAGVVIQQQKTIADDAHKDLAQTATAISGQVQKTESTLSTNINQYRSDTSSAVGRIMRPPRTLGDKRDALVALLKKSGSHDIAITPAHGSEEAIAFANEIESAFKDAGWQVVPTKKLALMVRDGIGLLLITKNIPGTEIKLGRPYPWTVSSRPSISDYMDASTRKCSSRRGDGTDRAICWLAVKPTHLKGPQHNVLYVVVVRAAGAFRRCDL